VACFKKLTPSKKQKASPTRGQPLFGKTLGKKAGKRGGKTSIQITGIEKSTKKKKKNAAVPTLAHGPIYGGGQHAQGGGGGGPKKGGFVFAGLSRQVPVCKQNGQGNGLRPTVKYLKKKTKGQYVAACTCEKETKLGGRGKGREGTVQTGFPDAAEKIKVQREETEPKKKTGSRQCHADGEDSNTGAKKKKNLK